MVFVLATGFVLGAATCHAPGPVVEHSLQREDTEVSARDEDVHRDWPALPRSSAEIEDLIRDRTRIITRDPEEITAADVLDALPGTGTEGVIAGWDGVIGALSERLDATSHEDAGSFLLVGCYHDSGDQVGAFRRLTGPGGVPGLAAVAVEQLRATGRWQGVPPAAQAGDDDLLRAFTEHGDQAALERLRRRHLLEDYTAWRYGYVADVMDLVTTARATGVPLLGCDMSRELQRLTGERHGWGLDRLREVHCLAALRDALGEARGTSVAMLWGQEHVLPWGLVRFLEPYDVTVSVLLFGGRPGVHTVETEVARRLVVNDPVLLTLLEDEDLHALLLPGADLGGHVERSRIVAETGEVPPDRVELIARSEVAGSLSLGERVMVVGAEPATSVAPDGPATYIFRGGETVVVGLLEHWGPGRVELELDPEARETRVVYLLSRTHSIE